MNGGKRRLCLILPNKPRGDNRRHLTCPQCLASSPPGGPRSPQSAERLRYRPLIDVPADGSKCLLNHGADAAMPRPPPLPREGRPPGLGPQPHADFPYDPLSSVLIIAPALPITHFSVSEINVKALISLLIVAALSGCAQLQAMRNDGAQPSAPAPQVPAKIVDITIPADALGARDPHLTAVLVKVGALASKQPQQTTIVIAALAQDFPYLNQSVKRGIASSRAGSVLVEDVTVGSCQPYSVQVKPTE